MGDAFRRDSEPSSAGPPAVRRRPEWVVVVPLKPAATGKSRLREPNAGDELVRAIGLDTVDAARAAERVARVLVVTADPETARTAAAMTGVDVVAEPPGGLNAAIGAGMAHAGAAAPRAALLGDLPALRPADLDAALEAAASVDRGVVADAEGTGSTLVTARAGVAWAAAFGDGSLARHLELGCVPLPVAADSTLRRDVDTTEHLVAAEAIGLGPRSTARRAVLPRPR